MSKFAQLADYIKAARARIETAPATGLARSRRGLGVFCDYLSHRFGAASQLQKDHANLTADVWCMVKALGGEIRLSPDLMKPALGYRLHIGIDGDGMYAFKALTENSGNDAA